MNLEQELTESLAKEFRKTMDFDLMCDIMVDVRGYVVVEVNYGPTQHWSDVMAWADSTCSGEYKEHNGKWLFELEEDATMFKLKWA
jgi:glutathione synthase/RimK-type ligase-like ATP-grasp enzyme